MRKLTNIAVSSYPERLAATVLQIPIAADRAANLMILQPVALIHGLLTEED
jgi:hypothetical protein